MFKKSLIIAAIGTAMLTPAANAKKNNKDDAKVLAEGFGYALTIQERCPGYKRTPEERKVVLRQIAEAIIKTTHADLSTIGDSLVKGARTARRVNDPTPEECNNADDMVREVKTM